jgi:hypothetical protein
VQGRLVAVDDSTLTVAATSVLSLTGENVTWTGERVTLPRSGVGLVQQRALSRGRTVVAALIAVAAALGALAAVGLNVFGTGENDGRSESGGRPPVDS